MKLVDDRGPVIVYGDDFDEIVERSREARKLRVTVGLGIALAVLAMTFAIFCASCASTGGKVPDVATIVTPEQAESALYLAFTAYETAVTEVNRAHAAGLISEDRYKELVSNQDSIARRVQRYGGLANAGIDAWRQTGDSASFTSNYALAAAGLSQLEAAGGSK